jgi:orotidine-5'-phosphate decarboxylase
MAFKDKWLEAVVNKNSVLCAGLDPAEHDMGRGDEGLPEEVTKGDWAFNYVEAVAPYCAAIKANSQFWRRNVDRCTLKQITGLAHHLGMVVIEDAKLADRGPSNDAGLFSMSDIGIDATTYSPFAGNMAEASRQAMNRNIGIICMCLMSNPEYRMQKNRLVECGDSFVEEDVIRIGMITHVKQYMYLAHEARVLSMDGIVIGAPSPENHITDEELERAHFYAGEELIVLMPGLGTQGGEAEKIWKYFAAENVIVNVGRDLMFPNGSKSTPEEQAEKAKHYQKMLNDLRG